MCVKVALTITLVIECFHVRKGSVNIRTIHYYSLFFLSCLSLQISDLLSEFPDSDLLLAYKFQHASYQAASATSIINAKVQY